jgi:rusticyanin
MQRNRILTATVVTGLAIGAASTGFVIAQFVSYSGHNYASQYQNAAGGYAGYTGSPAAGTSGTSPADPSTAMPATAPMTPASAGSRGNGDFSDSSLAQYIAKKAGTGLAGRAPQSVPVSQVKALSEQVPAGASIDTRTRTINFHTSSVSFTVVAIAPGEPDMTFTVAGLTNPTIIVPTGATVAVRFINNDTDEAHGWLITSHKPPFEFGQPATPAIARAYSGVVGDPVGGSDGANTITFTAGSAGSYEYICPMPGHAQMGMNGLFIVR